MRRRDLAWRLGGLVPLGLSVGTSLAHRSVLAAARHGPATATEFILGLLSFVLASLGVLLLINGARVRDDWRRDLARLDRSAGADFTRPPGGARHEAASIAFYSRADGLRRAAAGAMPDRP